MTRTGQVARSWGAAATVIIMTFLVGVLLPGMTGAAYACSCAELNDAASLAAADAVFTGTVTAIDPPPGDSGAFVSDEPVLVSFAVDSVDKGEVGSEAEVTTVRSGMSCGFEFTPGFAYRVAASYGPQGHSAIAEDALTTFLCSGTRPVDGQYLIASAGHEFGQEDGFPLLGWLSFGAVALLGLMPIALWIKFRRQAMPSR